MRDGLWKPNCMVNILEELLAFLESEAVQAGKYETGGILAGVGSYEQCNIVVTKASRGGPRAIRKRTFFSRDTRYCQKLMDQWAAESRGQTDYLGEWHKHYEKNPSPSHQDIRTLQKIAKDTNYHVTVALLLIIGEDNSRGSLKTFLINQKGQVGQVDWKVSE